MQRYVKVLKIKIRCPRLASGSKKSARGCSGKQGFIGLYENMLKCE
jgi:hypothetical protein